MRKGNSVFVLMMLSVLFALVAAWVLLLFVQPMMGFRFLTVAPLLTAVVVAGYLLVLVLSSVISRRKRRR